MLDQARTDKIRNLAAKVNDTSEMYQLIHAMFAIEKMFRDDSNSRYKTEVSQIWEDLNNPDLSMDERTGLIQRAKIL